MDTATIRSLVEAGVQAGETWADFGSGEGAFTRVLRLLVGPEVPLFSVDRDVRRLRHQARTWVGRDPTTFVHADFTQPLNLPPLDGVLLANALHFVEDQRALLEKVHAHLGPAGKLLIVDYDSDRSSIYVPYPVSYHRFFELAAANGFANPVHLTTVPSRYRGRIYSALARKLRG